MSRPMMVGVVTDVSRVRGGFNAPTLAHRCRQREASLSLSGLCRWHFQPGGGPEYCQACRDNGLPCARGELGSDGRLCPYREHTLISSQEHEAWDVLLS